ncbi:uncharacterized protein LOC112128097 [Cimex lectularius]|uniref:Pre-C2HC domain-containing protein n=1 Tax=Cimex lectularius TaxID=79782 RepID=A0A8I6SP62_CIMLE|nr:uncharacterized protein LOC112128097 [Cimex lectularius]
MEIETRSGHMPFDPLPPDKAESIFKLKSTWCKKYLIMSFDKNMTSKTFNDFSPFKICKFVKSFCPQTSLKFLKNGSILLDVDKEKDFINLQNIKTYDTLPIIFELHKSLNFSRGVISVRELINCETTEILAELKSQGVSNIRRIFKTVNKVKIPTATLIITFERPTLPEEIVLDFLKVKVRPYEPNPLLCFSCFRYRHIKNFCKIVNCGKCGENSHDTANCPNPPHCLNCSGSHAAYDKSCSVYIREKEIEKIRCSEKVSFNQAENILKKREAQLQKSVTYAQITCTNNQNNTSQHCSTHKINEHISNSNSNNKQSTDKHAEQTSAPGNIENLSLQITKLSNAIEFIIKKINLLENQGNARENKHVIIKMPPQSGSTQTQNLKPLTLKHLTDSRTTIKRDRPASQESTYSNGSTTLKSTTDTKTGPKTNSTELNKTKKHAKMNQS